MSDRADKVLVQIGFARSRSHARDLIKRNLVKFKGNVISKAGQLVTEEGLELLELEDFVGRGALKIKSFLDVHPINFEEQVVADIGASTGGFTEIALDLGAKKVFAVDVGHGQLAKRLEENPKVVNMEGTNVKNVFHFPEKINVMTVDLSFISTLKVLLNLVDKLAKDGLMLVLFKPQFEVGSQNLGANALVSEESVVLSKLNNFIEECGKNCLKVLKIYPCGLKGKRSGNQEYFVLSQLEEDPVKNEKRGELP